MGVLSSRLFLLRRRPGPLPGGLGRVLVALACLLTVFGPAPRSTGAAGTPANALLDAIIATMSPEQRVGQLVMVNFVGTDVSASSAVARLVRDYHAGAVLITASNGNVVNRGDTIGQVVELTNGLQRLARDGSARTIDGREVFIPLLITTDNEGDLYPYTNISHNLTPLPSAMTIGASWSKGHAEEAGRVAGRELGALGVNMLLGPVVDVLERPRSGGQGDIGTRSFGGNPAWAGALGRAFVRGVHKGSEGRMLTVAKHFPGHGGSDRSPDFEVATVTRSLEDLQRSDLIPFATLAAADPQDSLGQTDAVMTSHIRYGAFQAVYPYTRPISLDSDALPKAMSLPEFEAWRKTGLIVSDSLGVPAVKKWYDPSLQTFPGRQVARDALLAGNDLLALIEFSLDRAWAQYQLPGMIDTLTFMAQQYRSDALFRARADDALRRVLAAKLRLYPQPELGRVQVAVEAARAAIDPAGGSMEAVAQDALSLISPSIQELGVRLPRGPQAGERLLIVECWRDCYSFRVLAQSEIADTILRLHGGDGTGRVRPEDVTTIGAGDLLAWLDRTLEPVEDKQTSDAVFRADWVLFAVADYNPASFPAADFVKRFLSSAPVDLRRKRLVAVAFAAPYHLDSTEMGKLSAYFAVYSKTPQAIDAAVNALFRDIQPRGASPVSVAGTGYDLARAVQPDPTQPLTFSIGRDARGAPELSTSAVRDRGGRLVPDGTPVLFTLTRGREALPARAAVTRDGMAKLALDLPGGTYSIQARAGDLVSQQQMVEVPEAAGTATADGAAGGGEAQQGIQAAVWGLAAALLVAAAGGSAAALRRIAPARATPAAPPAPPPAAPPRDAGPLRVETDTRRVFVEGQEVEPALSAEQYRLLAYLYERRGRVCARDEIVAGVWSEANAEGVSDEAVDALVRRLRDRLAQAGARRSYITTVRGQGFRLDG